MEKHGSVALPLVTIGIPTYNGEDRIGKALESALTQGYPKVEILISDNASTDGTRRLCEAYAREHACIRYIRQPENLGVSNNFAFVLKEAKGKYFMWLSDDDWLEAGILSHYCHFLENEPEYILVSGEIWYWNNGNLWYKERGKSYLGKFPLMRVCHFYATIKYGGIIYGLMRAEQAKQLVYGKTMGSDWHFLAEALAKGKIRQLTMVGYHKHDFGVSSDFKKYASLMGEAPFWGYCPFLKIALDAFLNVNGKRNVFQEFNPISRLVFGFASAVGILTHHIMWKGVSTLGGKVLRALSITPPSEIRKKRFTEEIRERDFS